MHDYLIKKFVHNHSDFFDENQLPNNITIEQIEKIVKSLCYPKADVNLLIRLYSNNGLFEEAVSLFLNQKIK